MTQIGFPFTSEHSPSVSIAEVLAEIEAQKGTFVRGFNPVDFDISGSVSAVMSNYTVFGDSYQGLRFVNALTRSARMNAGAFSSDYNNAFSPFFVISFISTDSGLAAGNVRLQLDVAYSTPATAFSNALPYSETILLTEAVPATGAGQVALFRGIFTCNAALTAPLQRIHIKISRLGGDAADTYTGNIVMIGCIHSFRRTTI